MRQGTAGRQERAAKQASRRTTRCSLAAGESSLGFRRKFCRLQLCHARPQLRAERARLRNCKSRGGDATPESLPSGAAGRAVRCPGGRRARGSRGLRRGRPGGPWGAVRGAGALAVRGCFESAAPSRSGGHAGRLGEGRAQFRARWRPPQHAYTHSGAAQAWQAAEESHGRAPKGLAWGHPEGGSTLHRPQRRRGLHGGRGAAGVPPR